MKRICVQITDSQYQFLKEQSTEGVSIAFLIRQAIQDSYTKTKGNNK